MITMIKQTFLPLDHANIKLQLIPAQGFILQSFILVKIIATPHTHARTSVDFLYLEAFWEQRKVQYKNGRFELSIKWLLRTFHVMVSRTWSPQTLTTESSVLKVCFDPHLDLKLLVQTVNLYCWCFYTSLFHPVFTSQSLLHRYKEK